MADDGSGDAAASPAAAEERRLQSEAGAAGRETAGPCQDDKAREQATATAAGVASAEASVEASAEACAEAFPAASAEARPEPASPILLRRPRGSLELPPTVLALSDAELHTRTRRELIRYGLGAAAGVALGGLFRFGLRKPRRAEVLDEILAFDDAVAKTMYSPGRLLPTYTRSQVTEFKNNYLGATPDASILPGWRLTLKGLASGRTEALALRDLLGRFAIRDQITRLVCVEGWSAVAWWGGLRFHELLQAYPPGGDAKWARLESEVSLDAAGKPDLYFVSIDLDTARHPQTMLATHQNGQPLTLAHGAPLRLVAPMKLGLKHIKAITRISYMVEEPPDYWGVRGFSNYDGL